MLRTQKTLGAFSLSRPSALLDSYWLIGMRMKLYCKSVCTIMHDVSNNSLPANILNLFLYPTQVHSYNTRFSATGSFNIKYSRTNQLKHSFSIFGARIWNNILQSIRILPKHKFQVSLHQLFLRILELEDTYVDTPTLVNKLSKMNVK